MTLYITVNNGNRSDEQMNVNMNAGKADDLIKKILDTAKRNGLKTRKKPKR